MQRKYGREVQDKNVVLYSRYSEAYKNAAGDAVSGSCTLRAHPCRQGLERPGISRQDVLCSQSPDNGPE